MKSFRYVSLLLSAATLSVYADNKASDAQIAAIVVSANQVDIDAGIFAADKSTDAAVQVFAKTMVTDHTAVSRSAVDLVTKLKVSPQENDTSRALKEAGARWSVSPESEGTTSYHCAFHPTMKGAIVAIAKD